MATDDQNTKQDQTVKDYVAHSNEHPAQGLPKPPRAHVELDEEGQPWKVSDPEAATFELDEQAPLVTPMEDEALQAIDEAQSMGARPTSHHTEQQDQDMATDQEVQDDVLAESELIDMAQLEDVFDDPERLSEEE